jgi:hypothetical protein
MICFKQQLQMLSVPMLMLIVIDAVAAPPAGVPRRNQCENNLTVVKVQDLSFGDYEGLTAGTITVSATGTRTTTGPALAGGTATAAAFDVSNTLPGCDYYPIRIRLPNNAALSGPASMTAANFTNSPASLFSLSATPGIPVRVYVGADLNSNNNQAAGAYSTAAPFQIRFNHRMP